MKLTRSHLSWLESESIHILREAVAEARDPVMLFSAGKDSTVMAHLALRAFYPSKPPFPLRHVDSTWEFRSLIEFRDDFAAKHGFELIAYSNEGGRAAGLNPFDHGDRYTLVTRTEPLRTALDVGGYDIIFGGARSDEEKSRAKERIMSVRGAGHAWEPRQQRPELWRLYNTRWVRTRLPGPFRSPNGPRQISGPTRCSTRLSWRRSISQRRGRLCNGPVRSSSSTRRAVCGSGPATKSRPRPYASERSDVGR